MIDEIISVLTGLDWSLILITTAIAALGFYIYYSKMKAEEVKYFLLSYGIGWFIGISVMDLIFDTSLYTGINVVISLMMGYVWLSYRMRDLL